MPTERMEEVEVVGNGGSNCPACRGFGEDDDGDDCTVCDGGGIDHDGETPFKLRVAPGSLTSARLRLADAAEKWFKAARSRVRNGQPDHALDEAWMAFQRECEALHTTRGT